jgi:hypothetical protein
MESQKAEHRQEISLLESQRAEHKQEMESQRAEHKQEMESQRAEHKQELESQRAEIAFLNSTVFSLTEDRRKLHFVYRRQLVYQARVKLQNLQGSVIGLSESWDDYVSSINQTTFENWVQEYNSPPNFECLKLLSTSVGVEPGNQVDKTFLLMAVEAQTGEFAELWRNLYHFVFDIA